MINIVTHLIPLFFIFKKILRYNNFNEFKKGILISLLFILFYLYINNPLKVYKFIDMKKTDIFIIFIIFLLFNVMSFKL